MSDFEEQIRHRLIANANDFDNIVGELLLKLESQQMQINTLSTNPKLVPALILENGEIITEQDVLDMKTSIDRLIKALLAESIGL